MTMMMIDDDDASAGAKPQRWKPRDPLAFFRCTKKFILRHVQKPFTFLTLSFIHSLLVENETQTEKHFEMSLSDFGPRFTRFFQGCFKSPTFGKANRKRLRIGTVCSNWNRILKEGVVIPLIFPNVP